MEPGDTLIIGDAEGSCGFPRRTTLVLLDDETGEVEWSRDVPWAPDDPIVLDDAVVSVSRTVDGNPPSISALDLDDGTPLWQRFVAEGSLRHAGVADGAVRVVTDAGLLEVDVNGEVVRQRELGSSVIIEPVMGDPNRRVVIDEDVAVRRPVDFTLVMEPELVTSTGDLVVAASGSTVSSVDLHGDDVWSTTTALTGVGYHEIVSVHADASTVVVLVGSDVSPNRRLVVLDAATGAERWRRDRVREAEVAGDVVLYDERVARPMDEPTRSTVVVDATTGAERWRVTSAGRLGGYIGRNGESLVFVETDSVGVPSPVVVSTDGHDAPAVLLGTIEEPPPHHLDGDRFFFGHGTTVMAFDHDGGELWHVDGELAVLGMRSTAEGVLVWRGDDDYGCM